MAILGGQVSQNELLTELGDSSGTYGFLSLFYFFFFVFVFCFLFFVFCFCFVLFLFIFVLFLFCFDFISFQISLMLETDNILSNKMLDR